MPLRVGDRVKEFTVSTGVGGISLVGAYSGFQKFDDVLTSGDTTFYVIEENDIWEVGLGTYGSNNLERTTVLDSSSGGSKISLGGSGSVSIVYPASQAVFNDDFVYVSGQIVQAVGVSGISVSRIDETVYISAAPIQGIANYASGQSVQNELDIAYVSGVSVAGGEVSADQLNYVSGIAVYSSGQAIENESQISSVSGWADYSFQTKQRTYNNVSSDFSMLDSSDVVFIDTSSNVVSVTLPTAVGKGGQELLFKFKDGSNSGVLIGNGSETIDGDSVYPMYHKNQSISLISDNSNWYVI